MITEYYFPTPIYTKDLPNPEKFNNYLERSLIKWSNTEKGIKTVNSGRWNSPTDMTKRKEYKVLTKEFIAMQKEIFEKEFLDQKLFLGSMWANINYPKSSNRPHVHANAFFAGTYYVKAPVNSGALIIHDPRPGVHLVSPTYIRKKTLPSYLWKSVSFEPKAGRIIIFPAWLWHEVKPNESNDMRISISFNFLLRKR